MRISSRLLFLSLYVAFGVATWLAWRSEASDPRETLTLLLLACPAGVLGLTLIMWWLRDYERSH